MTCRMLCAVTLFVCLAALGFTEVPAGDWATAYTADFKSAEAVAADWSGAEYIKVADGKLSLVPGSRGRAKMYLVSHKFPAGQRVETTLTVAKHKKEGVVNVSFQMKTDCPIGTHEELCYTFQFSPNGCALRKGEANVNATVMNPIKIEVGKAYNVVAQLDDGVLGLWIDGTQILSFKDDKVPEGVALNMVGFKSRDCSVVLDKFAVSIKKDRPGDVIRPIAVPAGKQITITGQCQCAKSCALKYSDVEHGLIVHAFDGTPEVKAQFQEIMDKYYPDKGLDGDAARTLNQVIDEKLRYYLVPNAIANKWHDDLEYWSSIVTVTGTVFEQGGKRWIAATSIEKANYKYPDKMMAPDKPFAMPDKEPLILKVTDTLTLKCIKLPAGKYLRGSPFYQAMRWQDEFPHMVTLTKPFYMSEIPITQEMFEAVVGKNPSTNKGKQNAVENMSLADIEKFCQVLSEKNGKKVRIPTEGEWEWAARVGTSNPTFGERYKDQQSNVGQRPGDGPCDPVKSKQPNAWGLYDISKVGWEAVSDYKMDNWRDDQVDPQGPSVKQAVDHGDGPLRRSKGGRYKSDFHFNLHGAWDKDGQNEEGILIFRVVVEADAAPAK